MFDNCRIMLAGPSLLYAPLYLAKIANLTYAYRWVTLDYPDRRAASRSEKNGRDPLFDQLLDRQTDHDVILAVGDPFRLRYWHLKNGCDSQNHKPIVIGGLVQSACLWLIAPDSGYDKTKGHELTKSFNQIIVHRQEMTSFALIAKLLKAESNAPDELIKKMLFRNARLGEEHLWVRRRKAFRLPHMPFAYVSADLDHALTSQSSEALKRTFYLEDEYKEMFYTGLITTEFALNKRIEMIEELKAGIKSAISIIYNDPDWAAKCLIEHPLFLRMLPRGDPFGRALNYLNTMKDAAVYVQDRDLKVMKRHYDNALSMHQSADNLRENAVTTESDRCLFESCDKCLLQSSPPFPASASILTIREPRIPLLWRTSRPAMVITLMLACVSVVLTMFHRYWASKETNGPVFPLKVEWKWLNDSLGLCDKGCRGIVAPVWHSCARLRGFQEAGIWVSGKLVHLCDRGVTFGIGAILLGFFVLPQVAEVLDGKTQGRRLRTWIVLISATLTIVALVWSASDWSTTVSVLANWAVVCYAIIRIIQRDKLGRETLGDWIDRKFHSIAFWLCRLRHAWSERWKKRNFDSPVC